MKSLIPSAVFGLTLVLCAVGVRLGGDPGHLAPPFSLERTLFAQSPSGLNNYISMHAVRIAADCTDGGAVTTLQNPCANVTTNVGPQISFLASPTAQAYYVDCDLWFSQATVVADAYGVQFLTAPTNAQIGGWAFTNATAIAAGTPATIANTTATTVVAFTPAVTTVLDAHLAGLVEIPGSGQDVVMSLLVSQATAANVVVTKRGSVCRWWAIQ